MATVHRIFEAPIDPIGLWAWQEGLDVALATCQSACNLLDRHPDLMFSQGKAWVYRQIERTNPEILGRIRRQVLKLALPFTDPAEGRTDGIPGHHLRRQLDGCERPLREWSLFEFDAGRRMGIVCPDVYAMEATPQRARLTLLRSPLRAHHDPGSPDSLRGQVADQGIHEIRLRFVGGNLVPPSRPRCSCHDAVPAPDPCRCDARHGHSQPTSPPDLYAACPEVVPWQGLSVLRIAAIRISSTPRSACGTCKPRCIRRCRTLSPRVVYGTRRLHAAERGCAEYMLPGAEHGIGLWGDEWKVGADVDQAVPYWTDSSHGYQANEMVIAALQYFSPQDENGFRYENAIVLRKDGCEVMSQFPLAIEDIESTAEGPRAADAPAPQEGKVSPVDVEPVWKCRDGEGATRHANRAPRFVLPAAARPRRAPGGPRGLRTAGESVPGP